MALMTKKDFPNRGIICDQARVQSYVQHGGIRDSDRDDWRGVIHLPSCTPQQLD